MVSLHHVSLIVEDTERALAFYTGLLEIESCYRPELSFPGAWLQLGEQQIHLLELPSPDSGVARPDHVGRDRHLAMAVTDLDAVKRRLEQAGISYTSSQSGRLAIFCRDPDGNGVELIG
ncbi:VOC family protein [Solemya pervernicosa gill symbiont]|nr:VOC family protein [Candidatus Reidiella endopervernicosa]